MPEQLKPDRRTLVSCWSSCQARAIAFIALQLRGYCISILSTGQLEEKNKICLLVCKSRHGKYLTQAPPDGCVPVSTRFILRIAFVPAAGSSFITHEN